MRASRPLIAFMCLLGMSALVTGCAKRPALREVSAPAPTGVAAPVAPTPSPAPPTVAAPPAPAPVTPPPAVVVPPPAAAVVPPVVAPTPPPPPPPAVMPAPAPPAAAPPPIAAAPPPTAVAPAPAVVPAPPARAPRPAEFVEHPRLKDVHFDFDKSDIRPDTAGLLDANAGWLKENPGYQVLIEGHCDERGTNAYNLALGDRRARAAMNYLIAQGVTANRFTTISYGEERPVCTEHAEGCWWKNRRAHFLVKPQ